MDARFVSVPPSIPSYPLLLLSPITHIFVIDTFHEHQLPVCPLGVGLVLEGSAQLLDGYISVQDSIIASAAEENHGGTEEDIEDERGGEYRKESESPEQYWRHQIKQMSP